MKRSGRPQRAPVLLPLAVGTLFWAAPALAQEETGEDEVLQEAAAQEGSAGLVALVEDTLEVRTPPPRLPRWTDRTPAGWGTGVYRWDRDDLLRSRAVTLGELIREVPGTLWLRAGDYGAPGGVLRPGMGGEAVRVLLDGVPLEGLPGEAPDLTLIGLGGVEEVRIRRSVDGLEVELRSGEPLGTAPQTLIEAGTGDLDTNLLRATFQHPFLLGRGVALGLERMDARGTRRQEPGSVFGAFGRVGLVRREETGVALEVRRMGADVGAAELPSWERSRLDLVLRGRHEFPGIGGVEVAVSRSRVEEGEDEDSLSLRHSVDRLLARFSMDQGPVWGEVGGRLQWGDGVPGSVAGAGLGTGWSGLGSVEGHVEREGWDGVSGTRVRLAGQTAPFLGFGFFGEVTDGSQGWSRGGEGVSSVGRSGLRVGGEWNWQGVELGASWLRAHADSLAPYGLPTERWRDPPPLVAGGEWTGVEVRGRLPLPVEGLGVEATLVRSDPRGTSPLAYLPRRMWDGALTYHRLPLPSGNLEIRSSVGVEGRDAMWVPGRQPPTSQLPGGNGLDPELTNGEAPQARELIRVPWGQSWYFRLQIRVLTMRVFVNWENITQENQRMDTPERILPGMRAVYGIRWTLRN